MGYNVCLLRTHFTLQQDRTSIKDYGYEKKHFLVLKGNSKPQEKILISTVHHVGEINCQTLKKKDTFWNNIPPGKCDPYRQEQKYYGENYN